MKKFTAAAFVAVFAVCLAATANSMPPPAAKLVSGGIDFQENPIPALNQVKGGVYTFGAPVEKGGRRVLFVGNSITLHAPKPSVGWTNRCGMAASDIAHDYVHVYADMFGRENANASFMIAQVAGSIERSFFKEDWSAKNKFAAARDFRPDVIILFFGANVPKEYDANPAAYPRRFGEAIGQMLDFVDPDHRARVLVSEGFYIRPVLDAEKRVLAERRNAVWVKMDDIRRRADTHGRFNHPGDLGMRLIAERFWNATKSDNKGGSEGD